MKDRGVTQRQWYERVISIEDGAFQVRSDLDVYFDIKTIDETVLEVVRRKDTLFSVKKIGRLNHLHCTPLGKRLQGCLNISRNTITDTFAGHRFSPYFELFTRTTNNFGLVASDLHADGAVLFNSWVAELRKQATQSGFVKSAADQDRAARKNSTSLVNYIDGLHELFSKLLVVRLELGYSREFRDNFKLDSLQVKHDFNVFLARLRRFFPHLVGYIWKLEYAVVKSYHYHVMLFFNGHDVREDITLGRLIGDYWTKEATGGNRTYRNLNRDKKRYSKLGILGIGMIPYEDAKLRKNLINAALYLAKIDYYIRLDAPNIGRTLGRGSLKGAKGSRPGRPRAHFPRHEKSKPGE